MKQDANINPTAAKRANTVSQMGGSPRAQLLAARTAQPGLTYKPHQGMKERVRRQAKTDAGS